MKLIQIVFVNFTLWMLTALVNGLLGGTWCYVFVANWKSWWEHCLLIFLATLVFSVPGFFIIWIVLLGNYASPGLFRSLLKAGLVVSALSSMLLLCFDDFIVGQQLMLAVLTVLSTLVSIMLLHSIINYFFNHKNAFSHV